jgi:hypothetical protein
LVPKGRVERVVVFVQHPNVLAVREHPRLHEQLHALHLGSPPPGRAGHPVLVRLTPLLTERWRVSEVAGGER